MVETPTLQGHSNFTYWLAHIKLQLSSQGLWKYADPASDWVPLALRKESPPEPAVPDFAGHDESVQLQMRSEFKVKYKAWTDKTADYDEEKGRLARAWSLINGFCSPTVQECITYADGPRETLRKLIGMYGPSEWDILQKVNELCRMTMDLKRPAGQYEIKFRKKISELSLLEDFGAQKITEQRKVLLLYRRIPWPVEAMGCHVCAGQV